MECKVYQWWLFCQRPTSDLKSQVQPKRKKETKKSEDQEDGINYDLNLLIIPFTVRKTGDFPHFLSALPSNNQFIIKLVKMWPGGTWSEL